MPENAQHKDSTIVVAIGVITLVLALLAAIILIIVPAVYNLLISLMNYRISGGIFNSPWVGMKNYLFILNRPDVVGLFSWTLGHPFISAVFSFLLSLLTGYALLGLRRVRWLRHALCTLLLIPLIIPNELWAQLFISLRLYRLGNNTLIGIIIAIWCTLKYIGLPALLVSAAISHGKRSWSVPLLAGGVVSLAIFAMMGRFDFGFLRQMPPTMYNILGGNAMAYRMSIMTGQLGMGSALNVILTIVNCILIAVVAVPVAIMVKRLFPSGCQPDDTRIKDRLVSLSIPGGIVLLAVIGLAVAAFSANVSIVSTRIFNNIPIYIMLALLNAAVNTAFCYFLARPVACSGKALRIIMTAVLVLLTAISMGAVPLGEFMIFRSMGLINTWFAVGLSGIGSVWAVWALVFAAKGLGVNTGTDWFKRMWKPSLALFAAQAIIMMNNTLPTLLYESKASISHPLMMLFRAIPGGLNIALLVLATMAVPVILLLTIRTALNEKDSLGLFLPGK